MNTISKRFIRLLCVRGRTTMSDAPIGIFDSGLGGLTVAREIAAALPHESLIYLGDTARCPYGPRTFDEVQRYVREIGGYLQSRGVKLIVIACNTATAAGLELAQREFDVPVIGVIEPGARAAVQVTRNRKIGVIGTIGTIESGSYSDAVRALDADCTVISVATPEYVEDVEEGLTLEEGYHEEFLRRAILSRGSRDGNYLDVLKRNGVDTLVLGCTHYPLLMQPLSTIMGEQVVLVSSAEETAREVTALLENEGGQDPISYTFMTTSNPERFAELGARVFGTSLGEVETIDIAALKKFGEAVDGKADGEDTL
ncbi:MAG: glutamate racemase [Coriobacteriia bacterium]|nr:glutamate racemase [Coriobacteriia bacterium]